jgi:type II secretory pathway pseudopilin PulG
MYIHKNRQQKGYTLIETLLFLAIASITVLAIIFLLVNINRMNASLRATRDIEQYGSLAMKEINQRITNAEYIVSPEVIDGKTTSLVIKERDIDNLTEIIIENSQLFISQNQGSMQPWLPDGLVVTEASFERLDTEGNNQGIRYEFTIGYDQSDGVFISSEYQYEQSFQTTTYTEDVTNLIPKTDLIAWYDPAKSVILQEGSQNITYWTDISGNGNNMYITDNNGATLVNDELNGLPIARLNGTQSAMRGPLKLDGSAFTVIIVAKPTVINTGVRETLFEMYGSDRVLLQIDDNTDNLLLYKEGDVLSSYEKADIGQFAIYAVTQTPNLLSLHKNGNFIGGKTLSSPLPSFQNLIIGANSTGGAGFTGDIASIMIFDTDLSTSERMKVEQYLNAKYDLHSTLD